MTPNQSQSPHDRLIAKLQSIAVLSSEEIEALRGLPLTVTSIPDSADVVREGDRPSRCCLLLEGFLCRYKTLPDGSRQILSFHVPGDIPDLQSLHLEVMDHSLGAVSATKVAFIPHAAVLGLTLRHPGVAAALWRDTLVDAAIFREWIANVGRRTSQQRMAHVLCEVFQKLRAVGLTNEGQCHFPLTQSELADATGLSTVHVNRTLQALRSAGLIVLKDKVLSVPNWDALKQAGGFDPTYLHLVGKDAA